MAGSNISEPFVLATYTSSIRGALPPLVGAYASAHKRSNKSDEYLTVAAQADAVHILDVSGLHPVVSYTLGPSTYYSCPAVSLSTSKSAWTTYAVISSSHELESVEDAGRTIYMWKFDSASKHKHQSKTTKTLFAQGQTVHGLYACDELKGRIVALSCTGDVTIVDVESLDAKANWQSSSNEPTVQYASLLSIPPSKFQAKAFMIVIYSGGSKIAHLRILAIDETDSPSQVKDESIELPIEEIISASCNPSGYLSILTTDGLWFLYNLLPSLDANKPTSLLSNRTNPLHLANFSGLSPSLPSSSRPPTNTISLTSSHVLLATTSSHEIILQIWDLQFGVFLASYNFPIPASLASASGLHLTLVADQESLCRSPAKTDILPNSQVSGQAYLLISSMLPSCDETSGLHKATKVTSVVFVIPYTVPRFSTIAAAMGRGAISQRWLKDDQSTIADKTTTTHGQDGEAKILPTVQAALEEGWTQAAEAMFLKWTSSIRDEMQTIAFGYNFVQELLSIVFALTPDPRQRIKPAYPAQILRHILERGLITSSMLSSYGGILGPLRAHSDWKSIELAFEKIPDLTEMEIVETLRVILAHRRSSTQASNSSDAMHVDNEIPPSAPQPDLDSSKPMPLETYLHLMLNYPTTRLPLLLSFRRHLQDPEDVTILLQILSDWFDKRNKKAVAEECHRLLPRQKDIKKTAEGVWIVVGRKNAKVTQDTIPSLEKIISHISTLLDSSFLSLLSYKPSHPILQTISSQIGPELALIHAAQDLRGGLEPFALLQDRTLRESLVPKAEKEKEKQKVDWRQRNRGVAHAEIGLYTVEELVL